MKPATLYTLGDLARRMKVSATGAVQIVARLEIPEQFRTPQGIRLFTPEVADQIVATRAERAKVRRASGKVTGPRRARSVRP